MGEITQLEGEHAWLSQYICDALDRGFGFNWRTPICLPPDVEKEGLEMVFDYFRFAVALGRDCEVRFVFA